MILHRCDRCGSLSDDDKPLYAQNKYEDWQKITFRKTTPPDYGDEIEGILEVCKSCKRSFMEWTKTPPKAL